MVKIHSKAIGSGGEEFDFITNEGLKVGSGGITEYRIGPVTVPVYPSSVIAKVEATALAGRKFLRIINDSSNILYIKFGSVPDLTTEDSRYNIIFSGEVIVFQLDESFTADMYMTTKISPTKIRISEVK